MDVRWHVTNHVCRVCMGRILSRYDKSGRQHVRCADCGLEANGNHKSLCACGQRTKVGKDAGHRCIKNPDYLPGIKQEIIVTVGNPVEHRPPEPARGRAGKFVASTNRVPAGQENIILDMEESDGDE